MSALDVRRNRYEAFIHMAFGWTDNAAYRKIQAELSVRTADDFERYTLRLLRLIWSTMVGTPRRRKFDRAGADHLVWSDTQPFPVVVQCKGWEVADDDLGHSQINKCRESIESFRKSGLAAERYLLVHNRTGRNETFRKEIEKELKELKRSGQVQRAELWTRQRLAQEAFEALYQRFLEQAPQTNLNNYDIFQQMEQVRWEPIESVPLKTRNLSVDQYRLVASSAEQSKMADPCVEILSTDRKMAILIGPAGFGKSTAAFRLTRGGTGRFLYIPAATITNEVRTTTELLRQAISCEELLRDSLAEDYSLHEMIAREVIALTLKNGRVPLTVILDGLDESVLFNMKGGIQHLMNLVKEDVLVPILLTARSEYWHRREVDFATSAGVAGNKPRRVRNMLLIELEEWTEPKMLELLARVKGQVTEPGQLERLGKLEELIAGGKYSEFYGDIPRRPLFLRFIIDTVLEKDPHQVSRSELFYEWICQKILRDIGNPKQFGGRRISIASESEEMTTIELSFLAMTHAAALMTTVEEGVLQLLPTCALDSLLASHERLTAAVDPSGLVLNSLLVPMKTGLGEASHLGFAHRSFQEYFLARAINQGLVDLRGTAVPAAVNEWREESA